MTRGRRVDIPAHDRDTFPDGISCRDATIKLLEEEVDRLTADNAAVVEGLREIRSCVDRLVPT